MKFSVLFYGLEKCFYYAVVGWITGVYPLGHYIYWLSEFWKFVSMSTGFPFHSMELVPDMVGCQKTTGEAEAFSAFVNLVGAEVG